MRGLIGCSHVRHPAASISPSMKLALEAQLQRSLPGVDITKPLPIELSAI